jgi:RNA methyltransferase, TrmH family
MKFIQSRDNPFYKQLKRLAESGRERRKAGRTLLDGVHLVKAWEAQRGPVECLIVAESARSSGEISSYLGDRECTVLGDALMRELGLVETPSGLLAVVPMPQANVAVNLDSDAVLLDGVQDPGNVGTLLRTAAAAGITQVLLAPGCAAAWAPKVLRAGQGAQFVLNIFEDADFTEFMANYRGTTAVTCLNGAISLHEAKWQGPMAWVFGAEGLGVRDELINTAQLKIRIPMPGALESLNVGAAAAVCLFEAMRRGKAN